MKNLSAGGAAWWIAGAAVLLILTVAVWRFRVPSDAEENSPFIRADFSDDAAWKRLCKAAQAPYEDGFRAYLRCIDDPQYDKLDSKRLVALKGKIKDQGFAFIADKKALHDPEHPILVADLGQKPGRSFRVIPSVMWSVENNLSIANMDWEEFEDELGPDGVYRGIRNE